MASLITSAQVAAAQDPRMGQALNALSRLRGRAEALEEAIASGDARGKLRVYLELMAVAEEIGKLLIRRSAT